jgi:hypothetical protein
MVWTSAIALTAVVALAAAQIPSSGTEGLDVWSFLVLSCLVLSCRLLLSCFLVLSFFSCLADEEEEERYGCGEGREADWRDCLVIVVLSCLVVSCLVL